MRHPERSAHPPNIARPSPDASIEDVLEEAVSYMAEEFEDDEEVDGSNLVEWFGEWRQRAKTVLAGCRKR